MLVGVGSSVLSHRYSSVLLADAGNNAQGGYCCLDNTSKRCDSTYQRNIHSCIKKKGVFFHGPKGNDTLQKCNAQICGDKKTNACCLCFFHNDNGTMCSLRSQTDCDKNVGPATCEWESGKCVDRFEAYCDTWLKGNNSCDSQMKVPFMLEPSGLPDAKEKLSPDVLSFLSTCTNLDERIESHSDEEQVKLLAEHVSVCMNVLGNNVTNITVRHGGCSTFRNLSAAEAWMDKIRGELKPGQNLTVTANQADATSGATSFLSFHMTIAGKTIEADQCRFGEFCYIQDQKPVLCTDQGQTTQENCCRDRKIDPTDRLTMSVWTRGNKCPDKEEKEGYCCDPSNVGNSCISIVKESECQGKLFMKSHQTQCIKFSWHDCSNIPVKDVCCKVSNGEGLCYDYAKQYCEYNNGRYYGDEDSCNNDAKTQCQTK